MHYQTVARPYARALFSEAQKTQQTAAWLRVLAILAVVFENTELRAQLNNPKLTPDNWQQLILDVVRKADADALNNIETAVKNLINLLLENHRLYLLPDIAELYHQLLANQQKTKHVAVVTAYPLSDEQQKNLQQALMKKLNAQVELSITEDAQLMGGIKISCDDWVWDGSVKNQLSRLRHAISVGGSTDGRTNSAN